MNLWGQLKGVLYFLSMGFLTGFAFGGVFAGSIGLVITVAMYMLLWLLMQAAELRFPEFAKEKITFAVHFSMHIGFFGVVLAFSLTTTWWLVALCGFCGAGMMFVFLCMSYTLTGYLRNIFVTFVTAFLAISMALLYSNIKRDAQIRETVKSIHDIAKEQVQEKQTIQRIQDGYTHAMLLVKEQQYQQAIKVFSEYDPAPDRLYAWIKKCKGDTTPVKNHYFYYACACSMLSESCIPEKRIPHLKEAEQCLRMAQHFGVSQKQIDAERRLKNVLLYQQKLKKKK